MLALLLATPFHLKAQSLPDEINYPKYEKIKDEDAKILEEDLDFYEETVKAKKATEDQILQSNNEIQKLQSLLTQARNELSQRQQTQVALDRDIQRTQSSLQREGQDLNREIQILERTERDYQQVIRIHQPINNRYEQQRNRLVQEEQLHARLQKNVLDFAAEVEQLERKLGTLPRDIERSRTKIEKLESSLEALKKELSILTTKVAELNQKIKTDDEKLTQTKQQLTDLNKEIAILKRQIENARQNGTDPAEIQKMEDSLATKQTAKSDLETEKKRLELVLAPLKDQLMKSEAEKNLAQNRSNETSRDLNAEQKQLEKMIVEEAQIAGAIQKARQDLSRASAALRVAEQNLDIYRREFAIAEREWRDATQLLQSKQRELEIQQQRVASSQQRKLALEQELSSLVQSANQNNSAIASLSSQISSNEQSLNSFITNLNTLNSNLTILKKQEIESQAQVEKSQARFNASNAQFEQRLNLYTKHERDAMNLGASEVGSLASSQGNKDGNSIGASKASSLGQEIGTDLGIALGRLWANVRAEVQGFTLGYQNGRKAPVDMERAKIEGGNKGEAAANQYLEKVLRPKYFVQFLDELIEKSEVMSMNESQLPGLAISSSQKLSKDTASEKSTPIQTAQDPKPLTEEEIRQSQKISTSLDALISQGEKEVKSLSQNLSNLENYQNVFAAPSEIPYGKAKCASVYKDLAVFKSACANSYKNTFKSDYQSSYKNAFAQVYTVDFKNISQQKIVQNRAQTYQSTFKGSYALAESEGFKLGTEESYQEAVKEQYDIAYAETLKTGDIKLRTRVTEEVKVFVEKNATLGFVAAKLDQTILMPGSLGKLIVQVKNISPVQFKGTANLKITKAENILVASNSAILQSVEALSLGHFPALDYKISPSAKSGATLLLEGTIDFPGDSVRSVRSVKFQIKNVVGKNLVPSLSFKYDETPRVRFIFGYKKHTMKIKVSPKQEDAVSGYRIKLSPAVDSLDLVNFKVQEAATKSLRVGQEAEVKLSYKLARPAKGKIVTMTCDVYSEGVLIEQKLIRLNVK